MMLSIIVTQTMTVWASAQYKNRIPPVGGIFILNRPTSTIPVGYMQTDVQHHTLATIRQDEYLENSNL